LPALKRYIVIAHWWLLRRRCGWSASATAAITLPGLASAVTLSGLAFATSTGSTTAAAEELKILDCNSQLAAFGAVLGLPTIESQSPLDKQGISLLTVLVDYLGSFAEHPAIDETGFVALGAVLALPAAIDGKAEVDHRGLVRRVRQLRIASQVANQHNFVKISHDKTLPSASIVR
jgi:hypothetical protein